MTVAGKRLAMHLKRFRKRRGLTQETLARKAGISHGYVARLEIGMHEPTLSTLRKLAKVLRVKLGQLVD